jgi:hypothetical protein
VARIELYHATWVLERLREVFQSEAQVGDARASLKLEEIALFARKALDGETAKTLRAAASAPGATVAGSVNPPDPVRTALRAALSLMRADPPMSALESERFVVAAGGALAAGALGGATIQVGHAVVQRVLVTTARIGLALHADPIGDRASHGRTLVAHVLDRLGTAPTRCLSLAALALGLQGVAELGEATIDDAVLRGLEGHVRSVVARDLGGGPIADAGVRLAHVLLALSAVRWLEVQELADEARLTEMREELEEALLDAWERAEPMALPAVETVPKSEALVALVDARDQPPAVQLSRPALLHALATLHPDTRLPAAAAVLLVKAHL